MTFGVMESFDYPVVNSGEFYSNTLNIQILKHDFQIELSDRHIGD